MRISEKERSAIIHAVATQDKLAKVFLFGSRTQDHLKGGDIDLLTVSDNLNFSHKISILIAIKDAIGEQKIDFKIARTTELNTDPFLKQISLEMLPLT
jgi:predicted nucleotidyltransferase